MNTKEFHNLEESDPGFYHAVSTAFDALTQRLVSDQCTVELKMDDRAERLCAAIATYLEECKKP